MLTIALVGWTLVVLPGPDQPTAVSCVTCQTSTQAIRDQIRELQAESGRDRAAAARDLARVRWQCHPEVVAALARTLRTDSKPRVRAQAAAALGVMVPNLPISHLALLNACRSDPAGSVRHSARVALDAKGLRCVTDCPICGPLPTGAAITGPVLTWPEWEADTRSRPDPAFPPPSLSPALPDRER